MVMRESGLSRERAERVRRNAWKRNEPPGTTPDGSFRPSLRRYPADTVGVAMPIDSNARAVPNGLRGLSRRGRQPGEPLANLPGQRRGIGYDRDLRPRQPQLHLDVEPALVVRVGADE